MPWRSQLATCCDEIRQVARSSTKAVPLLSGTFEHPIPSSAHRNVPAQPALQPDSNVSLFIRSEPNFFVANQVLDGVRPVALGRRCLCR